MTQKWRVNILALIGALIGIIAIFNSWFGVSFLQLNLIEILSLLNSTIMGISISQYVPQLLMIVLVLCLISPLIALLSPIGGVLELIGAISFIIGFIVNIGYLLFGIGPYLMIISGVICITSMIKPLGLNYETGPIGKKGRLLTFSKAPEPLPPPLEALPHSSSVSEKEETEMVKYCSQCGKLTDGGAFCKYCGAKIE